MSITRNRIEVFKTNNNSFLRSFKNNLSVEYIVEFSVILQTIQSQITTFQERTQTITKKNRFANNSSLTEFADSVIDKNTIKYCNYITSPSELSDKNVQCFFCLASCKIKNKFSCQDHSLCYYCTLKFVEFCLANLLIPNVCFVRECDNNFDFESESSQLSPKYKIRFYELIAKSTIPITRYACFKEGLVVSSDLGNSFLTECVQCRQVTLYGKNRATILRCTSCCLKICKYCLRNRDIERKNVCSHIGTINIKEKHKKIRTIKLAVISYVFYLSSILLLYLCWMKKMSEYRLCYYFVFRYTFYFLTTVLWAFIFLLLFPFSVNLLVMSK